MYSKIDEICGDLETFDEYLQGGDGGKATYFGIDTGTHGYLCCVGKQSRLYQFLSPTRLQSLALRPTIEVGAKLPGVFSAVPRMNRIELHFSSIEPPDLVIKKGRSKLLYFDRKEVYTVSGPRIRDEVQNRQLLPPEVNAPAVLEYDDEYPYMVEEFIEGTHPERSLSDRVVYEQAFEQLRALYEKHREGYLYVEELITELEEKDIIDRTVDALEDIGMPSPIPLTRVHADFAHKNILVSGDELYLLDWELSRIEPVFSDLFHLFIDIHRSKEGDDGIVTPSRCEWYSSVVEEIFDWIGEPMPGDIDSLFVIYMLSMINKSEDRGKYQIVLKNFLSGNGY